MCTHKNFAAAVEVFNHETGAFSIDVQVRCADCGAPLRFTGVPAGVVSQGVTCSFDGLELRASAVLAATVPPPLGKASGVH